MVLGKRHLIVEVFHLVTTIVQSLITWRIRRAFVIGTCSILHHNRGIIYIYVLLYGKSKFAEKIAVSPIRVSIDAESSPRSSLASIAFKISETAGAALPHVGRDIVNAPRSETNDEISKGRFSAFDSVEIDNVGDSRVSRTKQRVVIYTASRRLGRVSSRWGLIDAKPAESRVSRSPPRLINHRSIQYGQVPGRDTTRFLPLISITNENKSRYLNQARRRH